MQKKSYIALTKEKTVCLKMSLNIDAGRMFLFEDLVFRLDDNESTQGVRNEWNAWTGNCKKYVNLTKRILAPKFIVTKIWLLKLRL